MDKGAAPSQKSGRTEFHGRLRPDIARRIVYVMLDNLSNELKDRRITICDAERIAKEVPDDDPNKEELLERIREENLKYGLLNVKQVVERWPDNDPDKQEILDYIASKLG